MVKKTAKRKPGKRRNWVFEVGNRLRREHWGQSPRETLADFAGSSTSSPRASATQRRSLCALLAEWYAIGI